MFRFPRRSLIGGILTTAAAWCFSGTAEAKPDGNPAANPAEIASVETFFRRHGCPAAEYAGTFVAEAQEHGLDWRLLPALAFVESEGGKRAFAPNNWFGYRRADPSFTSVPVAIHALADVLTSHPRYRYKSLRAKLLTYNPHRAYPDRVLHIMDRIGRS